jgi:hypothetical protein
VESLLGGRQLLALIRCNHWSSHSRLGTAWSVVLLAMHSAKPLLQQISAIDGVSSCWSAPSWDSRPRAQERS